MQAESRHTSYDTQRERDSYDTQRERDTVTLDRALLQVEHLLGDDRGERQGRKKTGPLDTEPLDTEPFNTQALAHVLLSLQAGKRCAAAVPGLCARACAHALLAYMHTCADVRTLAPSPVLACTRAHTPSSAGACACTYMHIHAHTGAGAAAEPVEARGGADGRDARGVRGLGGLAGLESAYLQAKTVQERQKSLETLIITSYTLCPTPLIDLSHCTLARLPHR